MGTLNTGTGGIVKADTYQLASGQTLGKCAVFVCFDGTGTPTINGSLNVSSITDLAVGNWAVNFTNPFSDLGYSGVATSNSPQTLTSITGRSISAQRIATQGSTGTAEDATLISFAAFR